MKYSPHLKNFVHHMRNKHFEAYNESAMGMLVAQFLLKFMLPNSRHTLDSNRSSRRYPCCRPCHRIVKQIISFRRERIG